MSKDLDLSDYFLIDEEDMVDVDFEAVAFIDFLKMTSNTWKDGANFDIDMFVIDDAIKSVPVRVLQRKHVTINDIDMYEIWALVKVESVNYSVPVRFHSHIADYNKNVFTWKVHCPAQKVDLDGAIAAIEEYENAQFESFLQ